MKSNSIKIFGLGLVVFVATSVVWFGRNKTEQTQAPVEERKLRRIVVGEVEMEVEVVDTAEKIQMGLSYRDEIGADGMLFVMPRRGVPSFWMKGMRFGLDFIWIDCEGGQLIDPGIDSEIPRPKTGCEIVDIIENVMPPENPEDRDQLQIYQPLAPVTHVLEVSAGWVGENGLEVGTGVALMGD